MPETATGIETALTVTGASMDETVTVSARVEAASRFQSDEGGTVDDGRRDVRGAVELDNIVGEIASAGTPLADPVQALRPLRSLGARRTL
jgi:hypothetical protein